MVQTPSARLADIAAIGRHLAAAFAPGPLAVTNLWFFERLHAPAAVPILR